MGLCTGRLPLTSGEVRMSIIGGIGAISLSHLHAELIIKPYPPRKDIIWAQCVVAVVTKEVAKEQEEMIFR